jgi:hypothetical protein
MKMKLYIYIYIYITKTREFSILIKLYSVHKNIKKEVFGRNVKTLNQMNIITKTKKLLKNPINIIKKYDNKKFDKKKIKCFKCKKYGHFANDCKVKQKINQL